MADFPLGARVKIVRMTSIFLPGDTGTVVKNDEQRSKRLVRVRFDHFDALIPQGIHVDDLELAE